LAEAELKLTEVELTPDGFDPIAVPGSRLAVKSGDEMALGVDYGNAEAQIMYRVGTNGISGYVFEGAGMGTNNMGGLERGIAKTGGGGDVQPELVLVEGLTYVFEWQEDELPFYVGTEAGFGNEFEGLELEGNGVKGKGQRVVLMPNAKTPRQLTYYSSPTMSGIIRVVKADTGEVDEGVSLPREGTEEETTDPGEGEQENALPVLAALSDVELEAGGSKSVSVSFSDSDAGDSHTVVVSSDATGVSVSGSGNTSGSQYTVSASEGYEGTATVTVVVSDGSDSVTGTFQVSVTASTGGGTTGGDSFGKVVVKPNNPGVLIGSVTINGEAAAMGDVVALYVGDELRGKYTIAGVSGGVAFVSGTFTCATDNESATFKVYDASENTTLDVPGVTATVSPGATLGEHSSPFLIPAKSTVTQVMELKAGWNLVSFYVEADDMSTGTVFGDVIAAGKLVKITSLGGVYDPTVPPFLAFLNTLSTLTVKDGYWVNVSEDVSFEVEGRVPDETSIEVKAGWNLVGYPRETGLATADELKSLGDTVVKVTSLSGVYDPTVPPFLAFLNTLDPMVPGAGYWLNVTEAGTWTLGAVSGDGAGNRGIIKMGPDRGVEKKAGPDWGEVVVYPQVPATVFGEVTVGRKAATKGSVVGVYVGNELRGQQEVMLSDGKSYVTLVASLAGAERVSFRIWEAGSDREYAVTKTLTMAKGETHGTPTELLKLNGLVASVGVRILSYTRSPFGIEFESESGREYVVESTGDLKEWKPVRALEGSGSVIQFNETRKELFEKQYYRVKALE